MSEEINSLILGDQNKPALILIHGWAHSIEVTHGLGEKLAEYFLVHLIDLPGHGKSPVPNDVWSMRDFADSLKRYLDHHELKNVFLVGHSFGGKTIIKFTRFYPEYVNKFVLINSSGIKPNRPFKKKIRMKYISFLRTISKSLDKYFSTQTFKNWFVPKFASADYLSAGPMKAIFVKTVNEDLTEDLSYIKKPALLLWGEKDTETPLEMGQRMHNLLKNSKLIVLPGMDHVPFIGAGVHQCAHRIVKFLE